MRKRLKTPRGLCECVEDAGRAGLGTATGVTAGEQAVSSEPKCEECEDIAKIQQYNPNIQEEHLQENECLR